MPSLSSEESPKSRKSEKKTKAKGASDIPPPSTSERAAVNALESSEKTAVNALLMAARAMTEMSGPGVGAKNGSNDGASMVATPPMANGQGNTKDDGTPESCIMRTEDEFETPQKNLLGKFMSPKRKASEAEHSEAREHLGDQNEETADGPLRKKKNVQRSQSRERSEDDDDSPKREYPGDGTPAVEQKVKRSRLGSTKKGAENDIITQSVVESRDSPMEMETPAKAKTSKVSDLTPVSARCIDFKKMRVNDSSSDPAVVDSTSKHTE